MNTAPKVLALIPARGGSKGLPRKNVLEAGGKPLITWTIDAAKGASCVDRVVLSSDDDEIMAIARAHGCDVPFRRPAALATDEATSMDVVRHALEQLPGYDIVILLQPTSPLRTSADIDGAFATLQTLGAPACVSLCPVEESPYWMYRFGQTGRIENLMPADELAMRRQDLPEVYTLNGAVYIAKVPWLLANGGFISAETVGYRMPRKRSLDIDTPDDFFEFQDLVTRGEHE